MNCENEIKPTIRNGVPTNTYLRKVCDKHGLRINCMRYTKGQVVYSDSRNNAEASTKVVEELMEAGFDVQHRPADKSKLLNGAIVARVERVK